MFQKVLLPLDRSPFSEAAIPYAAEMTGEQVIVLGVIESVASILGRSGPAFEVPADIAERVVSEERADVHRHLDAAAAALRDAGVSHVATMVREGSPGAAIVEVAAEEGCDAIVMCTHGRTGIRRAFLGSVANYVVHHTEGAAVLLVRPPRH